MLLWSLFKNRSAGDKEISATQAVTLMNRRNAVVVDVRDQGEFASGHLANARHIPLSRLGDGVKELEKFKNRPIVIVCQSGSRSAGAIGLLSKQGFSEVFSLRGGISAWQQANMPLEKSRA